METPDLGSSIPLGQSGMDTSSLRVCSPWAHGCLSVPVGSLTLGQR